jgi:hypothetical protein
MLNTDIYGTIKNKGNVGGDRGDANIRSPLLGNQLAVPAQLSMTSQDRHCHGMKIAVGMNCRRVA